MVFKCFDLKRSADGLWKQEEGEVKEGRMGMRCSVGVCSLCAVEVLHFSPSARVCVLAGVGTHSHADALSVAANWTDSRQLTLCR